MSGVSTAYLMYHEIELPGRSLCQGGNGYRRYVVTQAELRAQMLWLKNRGYRPKSVGRALRDPDEDPSCVVLTFDDGCETDALIAAPILAEFGFTATSYVVVSNLGRPGYLTAAQLRELADSGFEVGCHSMTHAYLTDLQAPGLQVEILEAKERLEQKIGRRVDHFSCPGGRWSPEVARVAKEAHYHSVATSRVATNSRETNPFRLARLAVKRGITLNDFDQLCRGKGLFVRRTEEMALFVAKAALGNLLYENVRSTLLDRE